MSEPSSYGKNYWCVKINEAYCEAHEGEDGLVTDPTEIYLYADTCEVLPSGALEFRYNTKDDQSGKKMSLINMCFAPGEWVHVFSASLDDGRALAVET